MSGLCKCGLPESAIHRSAEELEEEANDYVRTSEEANDEKQAKEKKEVKDEYDEYDDESVDSVDYSNEDDVSDGEDHDDGDDDVDDGESESSQKNPSSLPLFELGLRILSHLGALAVPQCGGSWAADGSTKRGVTLGAPLGGTGAPASPVPKSRTTNDRRVEFCVEATDEVMERIGRLLDALVRWEPSTSYSSISVSSSAPIPTDNEGGRASLEIQRFYGTETQRDAALLAVLRLCRANLGRFVAMHNLHRHGEERTRP